MPSKSPPVLRHLLVILLIVGSLARPLLSIACDVHAVMNAHASNPHDHAGDLDRTAVPDDTHGEHEDPLTGDGISLPVAMLAFAVPPPLRALPRAHAPPASFASARAGPPFRPPIA